MLQSSEQNVLSFLLDNMIRTGASYLRSGFVFGIIRQAVPHNCNETDNSCNATPGHSAITFCSETARQWGRGTLLTAKIEKPSIGLCMICSISRCRNILSLTLLYHNIREVYSLLHL